MKTSSSISVPGGQQEQLPGLRLLFHDALVFEVGLPNFSFSFYAYYEDYFFLQTCGLFVLPAPPVRRYRIEGSGINRDNSFCGVLEQRRFTSVPGNQNVETMEARQPGAE